MARSIWNGTITIGLVRVPVKLYSAIESKSVSFSEVHLDDGAQIEHRRFCSKEDKEVPYDDVVKGYEVSGGRYVTIEKEDVKAAAGERTRLVEVEHFVDAQAIDPVYFAKPYYLGPREDEGPYRVLHAALAKTGRAAIGRFTFHDREYLAAVRPVDDVLMLHTLRFADEVAPGDEIAVEAPGKKPGKREIQMAGKLVESLHERFRPERYEDTYRGAVLALVKKKSKGKELEVPEAAEPESSDDLMAALEASL